MLHESRIGQVVHILFLVWHEGIETWLTIHSFSPIAHATSCIPHSIRTGWSAAFTMRYNTKPLNGGSSCGSCFSCRVPHLPVRSAETRSTDSFPLTQLLVSAILVVWKVGIIQNHEGMTRNLHMQKLILMLSKMPRGQVQNTSSHLAHFMMSLFILVGIVQLSRWSFSLFKACGLT